MLRCLAHVPLHSAQLCVSVSIWFEEDDRRAFRISIELDFLFGFRVLCVESTHTPTNHFASSPTTMRQLTGTPATGIAASVTATAKNSMLKAPGQTSWVDR